MTALLAAVLMTLAWESAARAGDDWLTAPSYFTHDPTNGERVHQFYDRQDVVHTPSPHRSVYRHIRSSLQVGDSVDFYHAVDRYGEPVRPYGEWRFPFRPFSVPYPLWGPAPAPGYYGGHGGHGGHGYPGGGYYHGGGHSGGYWGPFGPAGVVNGAGFPPPWNDGSYPDVRRFQLPPQPFPAPTQTIDNTIFGDDNVINNN